MRKDVLLLVLLFGLTLVKLAFSQAPVTPPSCYPPQAKCTMPSDLRFTDLEGVERWCVAWHENTGTTTRPNWRGRGVCFKWEITAADALRYSKILLTGTKAQKDALWQQGVTSRARALTSQEVSVMNYLFLENRKMYLE